MSGSQKIANSIFRLCIFVAVHPRPGISLWNDPLCCNPALFVSCQAEVFST